MLIGAIVSAVFVSLSLLHWYWAFGGKWGLGTALPEVGDKRAFEPGPAMTAF